MLVLRYHRDNGQPFTMLTASTGWDVETGRNTSAYLDITNSPLPQTLMVTGERKAEGDHEIVAIFELNSIRLVK